MGACSPRRGRRARLPSGDRISIRACGRRLKSRGRVVRGRRMEFRAPLQRARDEGEAGVIEMSRYRFEALVEAALDEVPGELAAHIDNCVVLVEDDPPPGDPDLLGVYQGTPLSERG